MSDLDYGGGSAPPAEQQPIPTEGLHDAICYAVVNWGEMLDEFDGEVKGVNSAVRFFFELDEKMGDGKPFVLSTFPVAIKYGEKAKFVKTMTAWLGAKDCPPSLVGYPLGQMKGKMASINVEWKRRDDGTFSARIKDVLKPRAGAATLQIVNSKLPEWVAEARKKDNDKAAKYRAHRERQAGDAGEGIDSVPF